MRRLGIVTVGVALVVGIVVGSIVGNLFGATAQRTSAAAATGSGCYTNWNDSTCAAGWTPVSVGEWHAMIMGESSHFASAVVCASHKEEIESTTPFNSTTAFGWVHPVSHEPCAICCATGPSVVGGFAEFPAVAGTDGSGMGGATYAVLAGAAAGVLAFAVLATLTVKRRGVR